MKQHPELAAIIASAFCIIVLYGLGWLALLDGGLVLGGRTGSRDFVGGKLGYVVAASSFVFSFGFVYLMSKAIAFKPKYLYFSAIAIFVPPLIYCIKTFFFNAS